MGEAPAPGARTAGDVRQIAEEQAALRRVATLVARAAPPEEVFATVAAETGRMLGADHATLSRHEFDGAIKMVASWSGTGNAIPVGTRMSLGGRNVHTLVVRTGRAARLDDYADVSGAAAGVARELGILAAVAAPVSVEGRLWGVLTVASTHGRPLPADTEARLAGFTGLVATAIANTEAQAALAASRVRIVAAADATRRRIERNLHDGAQQRLVSLALHLREAQAAVPPGGAEAVQRLDGAVAEVTGVLEELREIARGLHPAVLTEGGLYPALRALANRSPSPLSSTCGCRGGCPSRSRPPPTTRWPRR
jgi:GAF domain-containing protein